MRAVARATMDEMSLLTRDRPPTPRTGRTATSATAATGERAPLRSPALLGLLAASQALTAGLVFAVVPTLLVWMTSARVEARWSEAVRVGADVWVLAHGASLAAPSGTVSLLPLGFTLVPLALCWVAGRRVVEALRAVAEPVSRRSLGLALGTFVVVYAAGAGVVALAAASQAARPIAGQAVLGGAAVAVLGVTVAGRDCWRLDGGLWQHAARVAWAALHALVVWVAVSCVVLVTAAVAGWDRVAAVHTALDPGPGGHAGLVLLQLALLPVLVVWSGAWVAGPGFSVGVGTSVSPGLTVLGPLPALPALGALPEPGTPGPGTGLVVLLVVGAGVVAGVRAVRDRQDASLVDTLADLAATAALSGLIVGVLAWCASGSVGPGRMVAVGPVAWQVGLAVAGEVLAGALLGGLVAQRLTPGRLGGWTRSLRALVSRRAPAAG